MSSISSSVEKPAPAVGAAPRAPLFSADAWAPLKVELFRSLWIATSIAQIGTWVREAAGPSLMHTLSHGSSVMVARVLVFSNLPICLFSVIAGALADVLDRRRLLIVTQLWMFAVSVVLGVLSLFGWITPWWLLGFIFLLGVGTAAFGPALQALLPELVPRPQLALAINMNSVALNVARALGPALFIVVVKLVPSHYRGSEIDLTGSLHASGAAFILSACSFLGAVWVLWRWRRPPERAAIHGEQIWDGIYAGWRYTIYSPANRAILLRVVTFIIPAVVIWSQVPIIATEQLHLQMKQEEITALLFTFVGAGAIFGVFLMPGLHGKFNIDPVVNVCTACFALGLIALSFVHALWLAAIILIFLGLNWVIIPTNFNTATQKSVPLWVKGRAISFYLTCLFGSFAIGGAIWGHVTKAATIHGSLLIAGLCMLALLSLAYWFPLTRNEGRDLGSAYAAPPDLPPAPATAGLFQTSHRYRVPVEQSHHFARTLRDLRLVRLRSGARRWHLEFRKSDDSYLEYMESAVFADWRQYSRSFSRMTKWDLDLEQSLRPYYLESTSGAYSAQVSPAQASTRDRMIDFVADRIDRFVDELFNLFHRLRKDHTRSRQAAKGHHLAGTPASQLCTQAIDRELSRHPFVPIRLHLADGRSLEIRTPDQAFIARLALNLLSADRSDSRTNDHARLVSLNHVVRVEPCNPPGGAASG